MTAMSDHSTTMETNSLSAAWSGVALCELGPGTCCQILEVDGREELERLKSMGLCVGRTLEVIKGGDPLIVRVYGTRIGLSARLAAHVRVTPCANAKRCWERMDGREKVHES